MVIRKIYTCILLLTSLVSLVFTGCESNSASTSNNSQETQTLEEFQQARAQWEFEHGKKWTLGDATFKD